VAVSRKLRETVKERDNMLKEVERGMDQVKDLYGRKVDRVERERQEAMDQCSDLQHQFDMSEAAAKAAREELQKELADARSSLSEAISDTDRHRAAARAAEARVTEVENEMRLLLEAFERERAQSASRAQQLQDVIKLWQH
jgi:chromosome segregation ATPase